MSSVEANRYWMPFTNTRAFSHRPRMLHSASGTHYTTLSGRRLLDATSGLWCVNAGHNHPKIVEAIQRQAAQLDYAPSFQVGHPLAFELADRVTARLPGTLDRLFLCNSGSEAVDTALKIALAFHRANGEGSRTRLIGRERGYHGVGFGGTAVGGIGSNRSQFGHLVTGTDHLRHTFDESRTFTRGQSSDGADLADDLERLVTLHGADTIAAVVVEPVAGSTGVLVPPIGYLERLRTLTARHGILLIFDEVITGYGRLGALTASERFGITPDLIALAKGMSNGAVPIGAVAVATRIHQRIIDSAGAGIELFHGYTTSGHPLAAAAALATLDVFESEGLYDRATALEPVLENLVHAVRGIRNVVDIRNIGLAAAIELQPRDKEPGTRGIDIMQHCFNNGVLVRVTGDTIAIAPPTVMTADELETVVTVVRQAIELEGR